MYIRIEGVRGTAAVWLPIRAGSNVSLNQLPHPERIRGSTRERGQNSQPTKQHPCGTSVDLQYPVVGSRLQTYRRGLDDES